MNRREGKRVLVLGATGMLGTALAGRLSREFATMMPAPEGNRSVQSRGDVEVLPVGVQALEPDSIGPVMEAARPDVIVNCIGWKQAAGEHGDAAAPVIINALFPHIVAREANRRHCRVIHISTDGVFSGSKGNYSEQDLPDPPDLYGRSKLLGEVDYGNCLTIRTSFYGRSARGQGLVEWLVGQAGGQVQGYSNYIFSGMALPTLAETLAAVIGRPDPLLGLYHVGAAPISKFDLLEALARHLGLDVAVKRVSTPAVDRSLNSARFWKTMGIVMPSFEQMLDSLSDAPA